MFLLKMYQAFSNSTQKNRRYIMFAYSQNKLNLHVIHKTLPFLRILKYNGIFYKRTFNLSLGLPLWRMLACLYLEFLESSSFKFIIAKDSNYCCCLDKTLLIYQRNKIFKKITGRLNNFYI